MTTFRRANKIPDAISGASVTGGPMPVGAYLTATAKAALKREAVLLNDLIANWPELAGAELARHARPARISRSGAGTARGGRRAQSTLHLNVSPAAVLDVQYAVPQLIERINRAVGFDAVCAVRIVQAPFGDTRSKRPEAASASPSKQDRLSAALARISAGVSSSAARR